MKIIKQIKCIFDEMNGRTREELYGFTNNFDGVCSLFINASANGAGTAERVSYYYIIEEGAYDDRLNELKNECTFKSNIYLY